MIILFQYCNKCKTEMLHTIIKEQLKVICKVCEKESKYLKNG